ncbi:unnamed protein product [Cuscuta campestris]|uniref:Uncharacterized protein n=1 Tax=Cuscuta campestris TaxID=132261 RepID=A0A484KEE2_9ASTE|nr:unnamed protein product [Cuscuta campestris]
MKLMLLTLWEEFATNQGKEITSLLETRHFQIIIVKRVDFTAFNGVSLFSRFDAMFEVDPAHTTFESLKKWRDDSIDLFKRFIGLKAYKDALNALPKVKTF